MALQLTAVLADPATAALQIEAANALWRCSVMVACGTSVTLRLVMRPFPPFDAQGYPVESVWLILRADGSVAAVCPEPEEHRRWKHRNSGRYSGWPPGGEAGTLCLWYPYDPSALRWTWDDGLVSLAHVVHRHLWAEERWRRTGKWPFEDAPHGHGAHPHPITDPRTIRILREIA